MKQDVLTQQQAFIVARDYNLVPYDLLMCERVIRTDTIRSLFFANVSNIVKVFNQYNRDEIGKQYIEGDICTACWSADKLWQDDMVPKHVFCSLSGFDPPVEFLNAVFEPGEPIKVGCYMLEQKNTPDCTYEYLDNSKEIIWTPDDILSTLVVTTKPDNIVRLDSSASGCFKRFQENHRRAEITY